MLEPKYVVSVSLATSGGSLVLTAPDAELNVLLYPFMQGAPGGGGGGAGSDQYTHTQSGAATMWTVNHNLGFRPAVAALTAGGKEVWAEVIHASANQALVYFDSPTAGQAICS